METKQHTPEQPMHKKNQNGNLKISKQMKIKTHQNLWDPAKAALRWKSIAINAYSKRIERSQTT